MNLVGSAPDIFQFFSSFYIISPLPVLWLGLQGNIRAMDAACVIALAYEIAARLLFDVHYSLLTLVPMLLMISVIGRLGTLSRIPPKGDAEFYPSGPILSSLLIISLVSTFVYVLLDIGAAIPAKLIMEQVKEATNSPAAEDQLYTTLKTLIFFYPTIASLSNLTIVLLNTFAAQGILLRQGRNMRPRGQVLPIRLPNYYLWLVALGASLILLYPGPLGPNATLTLLFGFFLTGLGLIHELNKIYQMGRITLGVFYLIMIVFGGIAILVCLIGLLEPWLRSHLKVLEKD